jgi:hypothetical protein
MQQRLKLAVALASIAAPLFFSLSIPSRAQEPGPRDEHRPQLILAFRTMYGVDGPFLGDANAIRGVEGDESPWGITSATGSLDTTGRLRIHVRGLVFTDNPDPTLIGKNDEDQFRGAVSCLTESGSATPVANVVTEGFKATPAGDSLIDAHVELPNPCVAPIVFVLAGSEDKWFAVSGVETEEEEEEADAH